MQQLTFLAFSTELKKLAAGIQDPDIEKLVAERKGKEYLQGGEVPSNASATYFDKLASKLSLILGMEDKSEMPHVDKDKLHKAKDLVMSSAKGGLVGAGARGVLDKMSPGQNMSPHGSYRKFVGVGAGLGLANNLLNQHKDAKGPEKQAAVTMNPSRAFASPAKSLVNAAKTGLTKNLVR